MMPLLRAYRGLTSAGLPIINLLLQRRVKQGKENVSRIEERRGLASEKRPDGPLLWIHAASLGETQSILSLIDRLSSDRPSLNILMTTGTVTSADLIRDRKPKKTIHQFMPVDRITWIRRFLNHWKPDLVIWVESEFWPNLLLETKARNTPIVLLNARISERSYKRWKQAQNSAELLMSCFSIILAQDNLVSKRLQSLGAKDVRTMGNLKTEALPLPANASELLVLQDEIGTRPVWLAASTHESEEIVAGEVHKSLVKTVPQILTIIVPRHPQRAENIYKELSKNGLIISRRSLKESITEDVDIYLVDSTGELGLFYRIAQIVFIGGSLIPHGGQNLLEAALLNCAILHGPHMDNFIDIAEELEKANACIKINDAKDLAREIEKLLFKFDDAEKMAKAGIIIAKSHHGILDYVLETLEPFLNKIEAIRR
ncbi:MAG: 3-deoxy-D-manno-octulosonic acid transferase [Alphaproteobacteria bacterium]|nr:3-deoxy-D-manno-octulosonic acid transferase [Alphaproteobacteria bacterium]